MIIKVVEAYASENKSKYGQVGDQTGQEVRIAKKESTDFDFYVRFLFKTPRKLFLKNAKKCAKSNLIGYSQSGTNSRYSFYDEIVKCGYDVDKYLSSGTETNCDCSSFVMALINTLAHRSEVYKFNIYAYTTHNMVNYFKKHPSKFVIRNIYSNTQLMPGDIIIKSGHTAIVTN